MNSSQTVAFSKNATNVFFHILTASNLRCRHCYINPSQHGAESLDIDTITAWLNTFAGKENSTNVIFLSGDTLSGGEAQRVRLAAQLGSNLTGILYILDEPTIGLHPRDSGILIHALKTLRDRGNTVLVVEHDEETIRQADTLIDLGPGAGRNGGLIVASGTPELIKNTENSLTGKYLKLKTRTLTSRLRRFRDQPRIEIQGACLNNLKSIDTKFPLGTLIAVTGVSGSGKSTLVKGTLFPAISCGLEGRPVPERLCRSIRGWEPVKGVYEKRRLCQFAVYMTLPKSCTSC